MILKVSSFCCVLGIVKKKYPKMPGFAYHEARSAANQMGIEFKFRKPQSSSAVTTDRSCYVDFSHSHYIPTSLAELKLVCLFPDTQSTPGAPPMRFAFKNVMI